MIKDAIMALHERTGSSSYAIAKHMEDKYKGQLPANFKKILANQLKGFAAKGKLVKVKASFKLSETGRKEVKPVKEKKPVAEKVKKSVPDKLKKPKKTEAEKVGKKRKAPVSVAKPKKKAAALAKSPKKVKKIAKSPSKPKKPKTIKSPAAKKARISKA
jgi:histone H1/5